jgi:sugar lactone lactonase YvrE
MHARTASRGTVSLRAFSGLALLLAACSSQGSAAPAAEADPLHASPYPGGTSEEALGTPRFVAELDATRGELLEGLFVKGTKAYIGYAVLGKIGVVDLTTGALTPFGQIPAPPPNGGFMLGIVVDAADNVYVGFGGSPGSVDGGPATPNGIYKLPPGGGSVSEPWATDPNMNFPNGLVFDEEGRLLVADSGGTVFVIDATGKVSTWLADPSLVGSGSPCPSRAPFPIGANGVVLRDGIAYVSNTGFGQVVAIPMVNGAAGRPRIVAGPDCALLAGLDGLALDDDGSLIGAVNWQNRLVRIGERGEVEDLFDGRPLDNPASTSVARVRGQWTLFVTNSSFLDTTSPTPGLLAFPLR